MSESNPLANFNKADFADHFGEVNQRLKLAEKENDACKAEFDRRKYDFAKGSRFKVTKDVQPQRRVDMDALRERVGEAAIEACKKDGQRTLFTVRPVAA